MIPKRMKDDPPAKSCQTCALPRDSDSNVACTNTKFSHACRRSLTARHTAPTVPPCAYSAQAERIPPNVFSVILRMIQRDVHSYSRTGLLVLVRPRSDLLDSVRRVTGAVNDRLAVDGRCGSSGTGEGQEGRRLDAFDRVFIRRTDDIVEEPLLIGGRSSVGRVHDNGVPIAGPVARDVQLRVEFLRRNEEFARGGDRGEVGSRNAFEASGEGKGCQRKEGDEGYDAGGEEHAEGGALERQL
ncbi:hypothetical protein C8R47DRAFT_1058601, partial [Mycena vitilis]